METNTYDAIVIGSGISGGWAAKELCDLGVKTLVLERGRNVEHIKDYPTATKDPWDFAHRMESPLKVIEENPVVSKCYAFGEDTQHFFVKDKEHPYIQEKTVRLDTRVPGGREINYLGPCLPALE